MLGFSILARYIALRQHRRRLTAPHQRVFSSLPQDFVRNLLMVDTDRRMTAKQALEHPWMRNSAKDLAKNDLSFNQEQLRVFNATSKLRAAIKSVSFFLFFHVCVLVGSLGGKFAANRNSREMSWRRSSATAASAGRIVVHWRQEYRGRSMRRLHELVSTGSTCCMFGT